MVEALFQPRWANRFLAAPLNSKMDMAQPTLRELPPCCTCDCRRMAS